MQPETPSDSQHPIDPELKRLLKAVEHFCFVYVTDSHTIFSPRLRQAWDKLGDVALELADKYRSDEPKEDPDGLRNGLEAH